MNDSYVRYASLAILGALFGCGGDSGVIASVDLGDGGDATVDGAGAADGSADGSAAADGSVDGSGGHPATDSGFAADGGSPSEAGPGGSVNTLPCGSTQCAIPSQTCCVFANPTPPPDFSYACYTGSCPGSAGSDAGADASADAATSGGVTSLKCSGAANCPVSKVCCVYENANRQPVSDCLTACGPGQAQLCDPNAAAPGCSADAGACSSTNVTDWGLPPSYATCGGVGN